jgi:DNA-binding NarL/FixJ family response regulator
MSIKIMLADDHAVVRDGIRAILAKKGKDMTVVGEACDGNELLALAKTTPADIYIVDIAMPNMNGLDATAQLTKKDSKCKVIILSMHDDRSFVEKALKVGAKGYLLKESASDELIHAIREVEMSRFFLSPKISKYVIQGFLDTDQSRHRQQKVTSLTNREKEIIRLISEGSTAKEIASNLKISVNTVGVHRNNVMRKLDIHKQAELIRYTLKEGISKL